MAFLLIPSLTWKKMIFNIFITSYSQVQAQKSEIKNISQQPQQNIRQKDSTDLEKSKSIAFPNHQLFSF